MAERSRLEQLRIDRSQGPSERPWRRRLLLLALAVALVAVAWWALAGARAVAVDVATVVEEDPGAAASVLDASGYVVARRQATVASKITGRLVEVTVEEGMSVAEGQILARLDDANARRALALAEAHATAARSQLHEIEVRLHEADLQLGRIRALASTGVASRADLDAAEAQRNSLAARLAATRDEITVADREVAVRRQDVEDTLVRAPFAGVAVSKNAQPGEIVSPVSAGGGFTRTGIGTIVDMTSLEIEVDVNEAFIQRVHPAQPVTATLQAYPEWKIPAHVITTVPSADRQKATVKVRIAFDQLGDPRILPDMGVKVSFQGDARDGARGGTTLLVPERALRREGDRTVVFVVADGRAARRAVAVGGTVGDAVEALSGVRRGERVVLDPPPALADGSRVRTR
ncbi:MAG TPA: efflux RND transporter periplasmic adaptor subunit [Candidatus Binatia bacterium]|nr:efflux RND transporter periplasmic adaptor subunit [Candidatus Binatia bacterium]